MATAPAFAASPKILVASISTANTARDGSGTIANLGSVGASGSKLYEVAAVATADPADSTVTWFLHDGSNFWYFDEFDLGNPAAASTTVAGFRTRKLYDNLVLPNGWTIRGAITVALTAGVINGFAFGGDL